MAETIQAAQEVPASAAPTITAAPDAPAKLPPLWRNRDFMLLWSGQVASSVGSSASGIVVPLLILALTGSPAAAGIAGALHMLPYALFSLPAGALVDRWDRKRVMIVCDIGRALNLATIPVAFYFGWLTVWQIYVISFVEGTLYVFFSIAEIAAMPKVVPKAQLPHAAAQNQATFAISGIVGPAVGTFLYGVGRMVPFIVDAVSYAISVFTLSLIRTDFRREPAQVEPGTRRSLRREIGEGLRWLWEKPVVRFIAFAGAGLNLLLAPLSLIVILLAKSEGAPEEAIGLLFSIGSLGSILGAVIAAPLQKKFTVGQIIIGVLWIVTLLFPLYLISPNFIFLGVISALIFTVFPALNVTTFSYRVALIPDELQGRVNSAFRTIAWGAQPLGALIGGLLLEWLGVHYTIVIFFLGWVVLSTLATANAELRAAKRTTE